MNSALLKAHGLVARAALRAVVLPAEGDAALVQGQQPAIGDGDAVGVAREIREHGRGPGERALGVDDPLALAQRREPVRRRRLGRPGPRAHRRSAAVRGHGPRPAPRGSADGTTARARAPAGRTPATATQRSPSSARATAGHDAVHVRVVGQRRAPGVQHQGDTDAGTEVLGVGGDRAQRLGGEIEQQAIDELLVV
jgi:hypothetical protein